MSRACVFGLLIAATGFVFLLPVHGQAVISTHSGVVNYFEGSVSVSGQPLEARLGRFATIPEGAELQTEQGRAEVLLTPGVFLRVGDNSSIRMVANSLADTRVELLAGSAIVDTREPAQGTSVTMIYRNWSARQAQPGIYRVDVEPPRVRVQEGEVEVSVAGSGAPVLVKQGMDLPLAAVLAPEQATGDAGDGLSQWSEGRADSISADNAIAANIQDPAATSWPDLPADSFTYFPMLGFASPGLGGPAVYGSSITSYPNLYGAAGAYQPGFYSVYLPGYTSRPSLWRLPAIGAARSLYGPARIGLPGSPARLGSPLAPRISPLRAPIPHPAMPAPHAGPHFGGGAHIGGHR